LERDEPCAEVIGVNSELNPGALAGCGMRELGFDCGKLRDEIGGLGRGGCLSVRRRSWREEWECAERRRCVQRDPHSRAEEPRGSGTVTGEV
jgi:hypothetical protein